jgi:Flp pilus assembly protein TadB
MNILFWTTLFVFLLCWPLLKRKLFFIHDKLYLWQEEYRKMEGKGKRKALRFVTQKIEPWIGKGLILRMDRLLRLSGNPWRITGSELIVLEGIGVIVSVYVCTALDQARGATFLLCLLVLAMPIRRLMTKVKRRQMDAALTIRFLKRRLNTQLKMNVHIQDALVQMANIAPGEFGDVFRHMIHRMEQGESMREVMQELRREYEVRELDDFCLAIGLSDEKTSTILIDLLDKQILEETHRMDEFIAYQTDIVKPKLLGIASLTFLFTILLAGYFAYTAIVDQYQSGNYFFGL